jgi:lipopolysaccharide/colanic/teichoic acid biosynthesis glycosyltransferase
MKPHSVSRWILVADLAWSVLALLGAEALRYGTFWKGNERDSAYALLPFLAVTIVFWNLLSTWTKVDCFRGGWHSPAVVSRVFLAVSSLMGILFSAGYLLREYVSRLALGYFGALLFLGFVAIRYSTRSLLLARYRTGKVRRVVIVGSDRIARELAVKIKRHPEMVCKVVGFLCPEDDGNLSVQGSESDAAVPTLGVVELLVKRRISDLILALPKPASPEILNLVGCCRDRGINVSFVPQPYELYLSRPALLDLDGIPILELREILPSNFYFRCKRFCDVALGLLLSIAAVPILLPAVIGLRWKKGRAFRWEALCGLHGREFSMLRLNVERHGASLKGFERLLESVSLTELPQLWNVLRGEMSLVGPRPEPPKRVQRYSEWQQQRLSIKPGMTGLAQVHGLRDQNSSEEKTRFDLQYILNPTAIADISILLQTVWTLTLRLFQYPQFVVADSNVGGTGFLGSLAPHFLKDGLPDAHRSQSSAD